MYRLTGIYLYNAVLYKYCITSCSIYIRQATSLIVSRAREARMGVLYKRKGRLVMAIAARVLVLVKSMETTRSYTYYFVVVGDGFSLQ